MIAVIKGDIIASRKLRNQDAWLEPLKQRLADWGKTPQQWEVVWGDFFQIELAQPEEVLSKVFEIKALIKKTAPLDIRRTMSTVDVRMAIGIGDKTYTAERISESNGPAFVYAGEKFDVLKRMDTNLGVKTDWPEFDDEINLYLRLVGIFMDKWSVSSAELADIVLRDPAMKQRQIGEQLAINQSSVSGRWNRAHMDELLAVENRFREKIKRRL